MKYLLIDTCSWINLINHKDVNPNIALLKYWIDENLIQIITHEKVILEWNEHKENEKERIQNHWNTKQIHLKEIAEKTRNFSLRDININLDFIDYQIDSIDDIIQLSSIKLQT